MSSHPTAPGPPEPREAHPTAPGAHPPGEQAIAGHTSLHGRPASWVLVIVVVSAFIAGGIGLSKHLWIMVWVCAGIVLASVPAGKFTGIMNDTVTLGNPADQPGQEPHVAEDTGTAADPGVDVGIPGRAAQDTAANPPDRADRAPETTR